MSICCLGYRKALHQRIRVSTQMMYPCFCNLLLRYIYMCVCELERKYRSVFGVIILLSLVVEGKLLDVLLFGCVLLNFGDFLTES